MQEGLARGKLSMYLQGHKLKGSFTLVKLAQGETGKEWLLIKHKDRFVDTERDVTLEDRSIISGLNGSPIGRTAVCRPDAAAARRPSAGRARGEAHRLPEVASAMQATLTETPFDSHRPGSSNRRWTACGQRFPSQDGSVRIGIRRRGLDATKQYPVDRRRTGGADGHWLVLDGRSWRSTTKGVPSFESIQQRLNLKRESDIRKQAEARSPVYYCLSRYQLHVGGYDLARSHTQRSQCVARSSHRTGPNHIHLVEHFEAAGERRTTAPGHGIGGCHGQAARQHLPVRRTLEGVAEDEGRRRRTNSS